jgi:hypothetical protein
MYAVTNLQHRRHVCNSPYLSLTQRNSTDMLVGVSLLCPTSFKILMKKVLSFICLISVGLSGCVVVPDVPEARVVISSGQGGYHCPPGQAKKGRC